MPDYCRRTVSETAPKIICPVVEEDAPLPSGLSDLQRLCLSQGRIAKDFTVDMLLKKRDISKNYTADILLKKKDLGEDYEADIILVKRFNKDYTSDILIEKRDISKDYGMGIKITV